MIALRPYPAYRDSGVEWLGDVPEHWEVRRLKTLCDMRCGDAITAALIDEAGEYPVFGGNGIRGYTSRYTHDGDFALIGRQGALCGNVHIARGRFWASEHAVVASLRRRQVLDWFAAVLETMDLNQYAIAAAQPGLSVDRVLNVGTPVPPAAEQVSIARFLDYADRRIRRYIRANERLIELLEEQKQALIHEAVTGRIDVRTGEPYPAYKDSGVEWLGQVPAHWEVSRLANIADMRVSNVDKHTREGEELVRLCNYVDVYHNDRIRADLRFMPATAKRTEIQRFRMAAGDVLLTKDSEDWKDIGVPALVEYAADDLVCGYHLAMLRPSRAFLDSGYLFRALGDSGVATQFRTAANGVTRYGLSRNAIRSVRIPLPPVSEQRAIAGYLDHADLCDSMRRSKAARQIALLNEYRARLIADIVTGKLDVRDAAAEIQDRGDTQESMRSADATDPHDGYARTLP